MTHETLKLTRTELKTRNGSFLLQDFSIIALSILVAILLIKTGVLSSILIGTQELKFLGSFIAGMFFTSVFTTAPAIAVLGEMTLFNGVWETALFGALGAVVGDLVIFRFMRDRFSNHLMILLSHTSGKQRFKHLFKLRIFRWLTFLAGGLIIASPLPDELGISLLGFSKMKVLFFIPLSFVFNFLGIVIIGIIVGAL